MNSPFKIKIEWIGHLVTIAFICGLHFFDGRYVTKADYASDLKTISGAVTALDKQIALLETERHAIDDHETRIRALEARKTLSYEIKPNSLAVDPALTASLYLNHSR